MAVELKHKTRIVRKEIKQTHRASKKESQCGGNLSIICHTVSQRASVLTQSSHYIAFSPTLFPSISPPRTVCHSPSLSPSVSNSFLRSLTHPVSFRPRDVQRKARLAASHRAKPSLKAFKHPNLVIPLHLWWNGGGNAARRWSSCQPEDTMR